MALFARHWGFRLDEIETPVVVWQGLADTIVPQSHGHHQAARLPRGELRVRPGEGHFAGFADVAAVLDRVAPGLGREIGAGVRPERSVDCPSNRRKDRVEEVEGY